MDGKNKIWLQLLVIGALVLASYVAYNILRSPDDVPPSMAVDKPSAEKLNDKDGAVVLFKGPSFDVVRISRGGTGVIAGRARPGSAVDILADGNVIGSVVADSRGEWVMILQNPLTTGPAELSLISKYNDEEPLTSHDVVVVAVPEAAKDRFVESGRNGVVAVLTPRDGTGPSRIMQKPGSAPLGEIGDALALDALDYDDDGRVMVSGRSIPRAKIRIYLDNAFLGEVRADDDGAWVIKPSEVLAGGEHRLRLDHVLGAGDVQMRIEQPFTTGQSFDEKLRVGHIVVQPGNSLWHIARRIYGKGVRYTLIFQENADQIRDPDLIYPGQLFELPLSAPKPNEAGL